MDAALFLVLLENKLRDLFITMSAPVWTTLSA